MGTEDLVREGEEAIAAADWELARACLEKALEREESPDALTGLSKVVTPNLRAAPRMCGIDGISGATADVSVSLV